MPAVQRSGLSADRPEQWAELAGMNTLDELSPPGPAAADGDGWLEFSFDLPTPGASYVELVP